MPQVLAQCRDIEDDVAAIKEWAEIFKEPKRLEATVAASMLLHGDAIRADIALDKDLWAAGDFWKSGVTTADLLVLAIGPVQPSYNSDPHFLY